MPWLQVAGQEYGLQHAMMDASFRLLLLRLHGPPGQPRPCGPLDVLAHMTGRQAYQAGTRHACQAVTRHACQVGTNARQALGTHAR